MNVSDISLEMRSAMMAAKQKMPGVSHTADVAKARKVAEDFEGFVIGQMLQPMFENLDVEEPFGGGNAENMWRSMQVDEYGKAIARHGGIGIADQVMSQILRLQEGDSAKALAGRNGSPPAGSRKGV
jgi:Rod binding domain-containing protein